MKTKTTAQKNDIIDKAIYSVMFVESILISFSIKDVKLQHKRRYTLLNFNSLIFPFFYKKKLSYYNFFLFLPIVLGIFYYKLFKIDFIDKVERKPNKLLNYLFYKIFKFEGFFINKINYPFGISIIFLGKKK